MRAFKILPTKEIQAVKLSKKGLERLVWIDYFHSHKNKVRLTCRHFGLSFDTFYLWKRRFDEKGLKALEDDTKTRRPKKIRSMTTAPEIIERIKEIRKADSEKSKYEIQAELRDEGITIGYNTIQKIINKAPDLKNIQHKKRIKKHRNYKIARVKAARELREQALGSLVQMGTKYFAVLGVKYYLFSAIDCKSRFGFTYAYTTISSRSAKDFLQRVKEYFPFSIQAINTDNGSEYLLEFHKEIKNWGIPHYFTNPHCPKQNGRVERFHQTVEYEFFNYQNLYPDLILIRSLCMQFNQKYNYLRYHSSLGYRKPADYVNMLLEQRKECYGI